jgi:pilus assembly protein CpaE
LPGIAIIAVLAGNDPDAILHCLRQGASDFLIQPFTPDQIDSCIEKLARILPSPDAGPTQAKVISVFPAKGAAGATTIACNLAFQCKRLGLKRILLADMDPLTGTVSFVLNLKSTYSFVDVLQRAGSLDADLWKQMVTTSNGIDVLLPPETPLDPISDLPSAATIIDYARAIYDAIILDCGAAYGNWNLSLARAADELLLVTTTELASVQAAQRVISYFEDNRVDVSNVKVVVNRQTKDVGFTLDSLTKVFQGEVYHTIPNEVETVQKSLMEGKAIPASSPLGKTLATLARNVMSLKEAETAKRVPKPSVLPAGKSGLLSSIFGR